MKVSQMKIVPGLQGNLFIGVFILEVTLMKKTIQNYSENHYSKLLKTIVTIHQC